MNYSGRPIMDILCKHCNALCLLIIKHLKSAEQWGNFMMLNVQDALMKLRESFKDK